MPSTPPSKEWMNAHPLSEEYFRGVASFLKFIKENNGGETYHCCPCKKCRNYHRPKQTLAVIAEHLICDGIDKSYTSWFYHGEQPRKRSVNIGFSTSTCHNHKKDAFPRKVLNDTSGHVKPDNQEECLIESHDENDIQVLDVSSGRTGSARITKKLKKESPTGDINRIRAADMAIHTKKNESCPFSMSQTKVCGSDGKLNACGMGDGVSETAFCASVPCEETNIERENQQFETLKNEMRALKKANKELSSAQKILEEEVATLKRMVQNTTRRVQESSELNSTSQLKKHSPDEPESLSDLPSKTCLLKNLRQKVVALGRVNVHATPSVETSNIIVDDIFEKEEYLYDREYKKFKDILKGDWVNWPKPYVQILKICN